MTAVSGSVGDSDLPVVRCHAVEPVGAHGMMTTRYGGVSIAAALGGNGTSGGGLNLGLNTADNPDNVQRNRQRVVAHVGQPVLWLRQEHGTFVHRQTEALSADWPQRAPPLADGAVTNQPGIALAVLTADCLPLLLAAPGVVAVAHAGWRGLAGGIVENTVVAMQELGAQAAEIRVWLGACIRADQYEVGSELRDRFCDSDASLARFFATSSNRGRWMADLAGIAFDVLRKAGIDNLTDSGLCTRSDNRFFSHRADPASGRTAGLIWMGPTGQK